MVLVLYVGGREVSLQSYRLSVVYKFTVWNLGLWDYCINSLFGMWVVAKHIAKRHKICICMGCVIHVCYLVRDGRLTVRRVLHRMRGTFSCSSHQTARKVVIHQRSVRFEHSNVFNQAFRLYAKLLTVVVCGDATIFLQSHSPAVEYTCIVIALRPISPPFIPSFHLRSTLTRFNNFPR